MPGLVRRIGLVGAAPSGVQPDLGARVFGAEHVGHLLGRRDQQRGIARMRLIEGGITVHHHDIPSFVQQSALLGIVKIHALSAHRFQ